MMTQPLTDEELNSIEMRAAVREIGGKPFGTPPLELGLRYRKDVTDLLSEIRRQRAVLAVVDAATQRIDASLDRVQAGELTIVEVYFKRVCARAEDTIARTHQVAGAHYAAMQVELAAMRTSAAAANHAAGQRPHRKPSKDAAPLEQEIAWYKAHLGESGSGGVFEAAFITGLEQARDVMRQALAALIEIAESEPLDREELIATLKLWQGKSISSQEAGV